MRRAGGGESSHSRRELRGGVPSLKVAEGREIEKKDCSESHSVFVAAHDARAGARAGAMALGGGGAALLPFDGRHCCCCVFILSRFLLCVFRYSTVRISDISEVYLEMYGLRYPCGVIPEN